MILCDVGPLLSAMVSASPHHRVCKERLEVLRAGAEPFAFSELILAAVVRIGTHERVFRPAPEPAEVFAFAEAWRSHPRAIRIEPGERHWEIFRDLVLATGLRGADTTDAYLAALAIEHGCEWWTIDRGFSRFAGLSWQNLLST
jgi:hypothetical protein